MMKKFLLTLLVMASVLFAPIVIEGQVSSSGNGSIKKGPSLPATCAVGLLFSKTSVTTGVYFCSATNTWTLLENGGVGTGDALQSLTLAQFAATTSSQFKGVISDENAPDGASSKVLMALLVRR